MRLFVDNLINVDFSYLHPERGLVGETWLASVQLQGGLDHQGMVCDFGVVKKRIREWLDRELDHRLLVPALSPSLTHASMGNDQQVTWQYANRHLECTSPEQAITLVDRTEITADSVADWAARLLQQQFPESVLTLTLRLQPEAIDSPFYHYSHGLKKHSGNCQRVAHGHRSKIEIWRNGVLSLSDMSEWAARFQDIYIGTRADIAETSENQYVFRYSASQGAFELRIPTEDCYIIDSDSTVEWIAQHIADTLKQSAPQDHIVVKAYEGMGKGAIAEA